MTHVSPSDLVAVASPPPLAGRAREQERLRAALQAALAGRGGLILVGGEAGIGKTTLIDWLAAEARQQGALVLEGHCFDLTQAPPYGPWREAMAANGRGASEHGEAAASPFRLDDDRGEITSQERLFAEVRGQLAALAAGQPVLLILEDLHWSDPASLELLRGLARDIASLPLLLVATYRVDALTRRHPLFTLLPHLVREAQAARIDLPALDAAEIGRLIAQRYRLSAPDQMRLAAYLHSRAGGNPFYLGEVLRSLEAGGHLMATAEGWTLGALDRVTFPPLVEQIIESRLAGLDESTQRLLETAAVLGEEVSLDLLAGASERPLDALGPPLEQALAAHFLRETSGSGQLHFAHALVRDAMYLRQTSFARRATHRRVAELLANRADPPLSVIASHFAAAEDPRAVAWLVRAGEQALALYAARDAVEALTRAHELAVRSGELLPAPAYRIRAQAYTLQGEFDSARRDYELILERSRNEGERHAEWQALLDLGMLWAERDYDRTGSYVRAALDLARAIGDELTIARGLNRLANWHVNLDEADQALPIHKEALAIFERLQDREGIAETLDLLAMANYLDCANLASTANYERAIPLFRELNNRPRLAFCLSMLALSGSDLEAAIAPTYRETPFWIRSAEEGLEIAREIGWSAGESFAHFSLSVVTGINGQFGRALDHARAAQRVARQIDHHQWSIAALCGLSSVWTALLDTDRAIADLEQGLAAARISGSRYWTHQMAGRLASELIAGGQQDRAAALLGTIVPPGRPARSMGQRHCWLARIELFLAEHDPERALDAIAALAEVNPEAMNPPGPPLLLKLRGDALVQLQRHEDAAQAYQAARNSAALYGYRSYLWQVDAALGSLFSAMGRQGEAEAAQQSALAMIDDLAMTLPDEAMREQFRARAVARLPGDTAGQRADRAATSLSPRELDVLRLIVEGLSDREIGDTLSISPRTVMRHVTGILTKLNVPSRTAAATLAMRQQIV